jgi:recombination protein RecR
MALHLLERHQDRGAELAMAIGHALNKVQRCVKCNNFSEQDICHICSDPRREASLLCVVESATDVVAIEQTSVFRGRYFVLMGHLSPIDGIGAKEIGIDKLQLLLQSGHDISELILATGATLEGETTAHFIAEVAKGMNVSVTRLAHGIPMGGELGMIDAGTLSYALQGRKSIAEPNQ